MPPTTWDSASSPLQVQCGPLQRTYLAACRYFATERWQFSEPVAALTSSERFELLIVLEGHGRIESDSESSAYRAGECWFMPAESGRVSVGAGLAHDFAAHLRPRPARIRATNLPLARGRRRSGATLAWCIRDRRESPRPTSSFWPAGAAPASGRAAGQRTPKQLLNIVGRQTMLEQTFDRLAPLIPPSHIWVVTNTEQAASVRRQLPQVPASQILAEPVGRNTAAAIGLAAAHISHHRRRNQPKRRALNRDRETPEQTDQTT